MNNIDLMLDISVPKMIFSFTLQFAGAVQQGKNQVPKQEEEGAESYLDKVEIKFIIMDDRESPTNDLHLNLQDVLPTDIHEERIKTPLASPDENENQCNSRKHNTLKNSHNAMGRVEQDSINNNEDSGDYTPCFQEDESDRPCKSLKSDMPQKLGFEKKNPRKTKKKAIISLNISAVKQEKADFTAVSYVQGADGNKINSNHPLKEPAQTLQFLFSLLQGELKQMDSNVLPLFLHQVMRKQWSSFGLNKTKWKATTCSEVPNLKNSSKDLNNEELDKLAEFCTSHQDS
ncbi:Consortin, partial [Ophiophagus hannah]